MTAAERSMTVTGRAWIFGDEVNTDDMYPGFAFRLPLEEAVEFMFDASRPGWPKLIEPGDIVVAGRNFGLGSSRGVAELFLHLGVSCLVAEQYNSLFLRNCLNYGLPAITVPDVRAFVKELDVITIDLEQGTLTNSTQNTQHTFSGFEGFIADMLRSGGLVNQLESSGLLSPSATAGGKH